SSSATSPTATYPLSLHDALPISLLETNQHLLEHGRARAPSGPCPRCTIVPPVYIEEGVTIHDATIGPNVSIEAGSFVAESTIANSILGRSEEHTSELQSRGHLVCRLL